MSSQSPTHLRTKALTAGQERRLVAYLDDQFLELTRGYKKRTSPLTTVPTLHAYLSFARRLLALILQIPPVDPSTSLRTQYLLRLTGDVLNAIPGYELPSGSMGNAAKTIDGERGGGEEDEGPRDYQSALRELLDWLDDLDQAWLAVLQSQVWDPEAGEGVDLVLDVGGDESRSGALEVNGEEEMGREGESVVNDSRKSGLLMSTPVSQTEVARLKSLLVTSVSSLEEWLGKGGNGRGNDSSAAATGEADVTEMLERLGLMEEFDELFVRTMDFLGGFGGYVVEPESVGGAVEVEMAMCS